MTKKPSKRDREEGLDYGTVSNDVAGIIEAARRSAVRAVNAAMTTAYWLIGRRIVEYEQGGKERAEYGEMLLQRLAQDLTAQFGRGFSYPNLNKFRQFYLSYPPERILSTPPIGSDTPILSTVSIELKPTRLQTPSGECRRTSRPKVGLRRDASHRDLTQPTLYPIVNTCPRGCARGVLGRIARARAVSHCGCDSRRGPRCFARRAGGRSCRRNGRRRRVDPARPIGRAVLLSV